jgi:hypothetical protein
MTEHDQRLCPRCGKPAGNARFCPTCGLSVDSLTGSAAPGQWRGGEPTYPVAQAPVEAPPFAQTSAVEPNGFVDGIANGVPATPVAGVDSDPGMRPAGWDRGSVEDRTVAAVATPPRIEFETRSQWWGTDRDDPAAQEPVEESPFAQTPGVEPNGFGGRMASEASVAPAPAVDSDPEVPAVDSEQSSVEDTTLDPVATPPGLESATPSEWQDGDRDDPVAQAPRASSPFADAPRIAGNGAGDRTASRAAAASESKRQRVALILLIALVLVVVLTGRDLRRYL